MVVKGVGYVSCMTISSKGVPALPMQYVGFQRSIFVQSVLPITQSESNYVSHSVGLVLLCGATTLDATRPVFGTSWAAIAGWWTLSIALWAAVDWTVYLLLHSGCIIETHGAAAQVPQFAKPRRAGPFLEWLRAWLGREAIWGGVTVTWRERNFRVGLGMRVHEIEERDPRGQGQREVVPVVTAERHMNGHGSNGKKRSD